MYSDNSFTFRGVDIAIVILSLKLLLSSSLFFNIPKNIENFMVLLAYILILIHSFSRKHKRNIIIFFLIGFLLLYTSYILKNYLYISTYMLILASIDYPIKHVVKLMFYTILFVFGINFLISVGYFIFGNNSLVFTIRRDIKGFNFGFVHPNIANLIVYSLCTMWIYLNYEKIDINNVIILFLIQLVVFLLTKTRTSFFIACFVLIFIFIVKKYSKEIPEIYLCTFFAIGLAVIACTFAYTKNYSFTRVVNKLLTGRINLGAYALSTYGLNFLPKYFSYRIGWLSQWGINAFTFDNAYNFLMINAGYIWFIIIGLGFAFQKNRLSNAEKILYICWCIYAISETDILLPQYGFQILFLSYLFTEKEVEYG